jgi:hypothetical protein
MRCLSHDYTHQQIKIDHMPGVADCQPSVMDALGIYCGIPRD